MSVALLWPAGLLALGALLLPLLLHLTRRLERTRTEFAALRWIQALVRPRSRIRVQRWWLLLLRLLLLAVATLLLAQPVWRQIDALPPWVAVVPGVPATALQAPELSADATRVWLAPGFPALAAATPVIGQAVNTASLLRQLDQELPAGTALIVIVPPQLAGLDGQRLELGRAVTWRVVDAAVVASPVVATTSDDRASSARNGAGRLPAALAIVADSDGAAQQRILRAAVAGWNAARDDGQAEVGLQLLSADQPLPASEQIVAWLVEGLVPPRLLDWIAAGGTALLDARASLPQAADSLPLLRATDGAVQVRAVRIGAGRAVLLQQTLALADWPLLAEAGFPEQLLHWLRPVAIAAPTRGDAAALAPEVNPALVPDPPLRAFTSPLALLLASLFLLERMVAGWPRRQARA